MVFILWFLKKKNNGQYRPHCSSVQFKYINLTTFILTVAYKNTQN